MNLSHDDLIELMAYADGELAGDTAALSRVEERLRVDEEARRVLASMGALSDWVRGDLTNQTSISRADDLASAVMRKISNQAGGALPLRRKAVATGRTLRRVAAGGLVGVLALAAGVALVARGRGPLLPTSADVQHEVARTGEVPEPSPPGEGRAELAPSEAKPTEVAASEPEGSGVDVEKVESNSRPFSVFYLPAVSAAVNSNVSSVVVWIGDDKKGH